MKVRLLNQQRAPASSIVFFSTSMASAGASLFPVKFSTILFSPTISPVAGTSTSNPISTRQFAISTDDQAPAPAPTTKKTKPTEWFSENTSFTKTTEEAQTTSLHREERRSSWPYPEFEELETEEEKRSSLIDYFEQAKDLIRSDGGPPRWFSPLECGSRFNNSPLLLFLPGLVHLYFTFLSFLGGGI